MRWVEGDLLNLSKVVLHILVEEEFSDLAERELALRPHMCEIKDIDLLVLPQILGFLGSHGLDAYVPTWEIAFLNGLVQVLGRIVGAVIGRVFLCNEASALLRLEMKLHVDPVSILVQKLVCVPDVSMHFTVAIWDTTVTEQDHELVD
jgi:hypothetical protein